MTPSLRQDLLTATPRFTHRIRVTFADVDAAGLVFFARTCAFFHQAYVELRRGRSEKIAEYTTRPTSRIISTEADYLRPLRAGDHADVLIVSSAFAGGQATIGFRIVTTIGEVVAIGTLVHTTDAAVELPLTSP